MPIQSNSSKIVECDVAYLDGIVPRLRVGVQVLDEALGARQQALLGLGRHHRADDVRGARVDRRLQPHTNAVVSRMHRHHHITIHYITLFFLGIFMVWDKSEQKSNRTTRAQNLYRFCRINTIIGIICEWGKFKNVWFMNYILSSRSSTY